MGLDYEKYLEKNGVIENEPFDQVFGPRDEPDQLPDPEDSSISLEQLMGGDE
jgi:hypothetical protein